MKQYTQPINMTGREALLLSEPESDLPCSDESQNGETKEKSSPLRKVNIDDKQA